MTTAAECLKNLIDELLLTEGFFVGIKELHCFDGITNINKVDAIAYLVFEYSLDDSVFNSRQRYLSCALNVEIDDLQESRVTFPIVGIEQHYINYDLPICDAILNTVKEKLKIVKFDKIKSRFTFFNIVETKLVDFITDDNPNITKSYDMCCVCMEGTQKQTLCCKAHLCVLCNIKITELPCEECLNDRDDDCNNIECMKRPCPLCRKKLLLYDSEIRQ